MAVVKSTKIVVEEINSINGLQDFQKTQNMQNCAFRYKLDTNGKSLKVLIYKAKLTF